MWPGWRMKDENDQADEQRRQYCDKNHQKAFRQGVYFCFGSLGITTPTFSRQQFTSAFQCIALVR
jgi:hypothetical protein